GLVVQGQKAPGVAKELFARGGERQAAAVALEERLPERFLEPLDLQRNRRLADVELCARPRHAAHLGHSQERADGRDVEIARHWHSPPDGPARGKLMPRRNGRPIADSARRCEGAARLPRPLFVYCCTMSS